MNAFGGVLLLLTGAAAQDPFYAESQVSSTMFQGTIEPGSGKNLMLDFQIGIGLRLPGNPGIGYRFSDLPSGFSVAMDDGNEYPYDLMINSLGILLSCEKGIFFCRAFPAFSFVTVHGRTEWLKAKYTADLTRSSGWSVSLIPGVKYEPFYVGLTANYYSWSSEGDFARYRYDLFGWQLTATGSHSCRLSGWGFGLTLGVRISKF